MEVCASDDPKGLKYTWHAQSDKQSRIGTNSGVAITNIQHVSYVRVVSMCIVLVLLVLCDASQCHCECV